VTYVCHSPAPSEPEVPLETACKLSEGSCLDRTCTSTCRWYWQGSCANGERCKFCHLCTQEDVAEAKRKLRRSNEPTKKSHLREGAQQSKSSSAARTALGGDLPSKKSHVREGARQSESSPTAQTLLGGDLPSGVARQDVVCEDLSSQVTCGGLPSQGSCKDGMCSRGCAWHLEQECTKGDLCNFCHVCPPQAHAMGARERLEALKELRVKRKDKKEKKRAALHAADGQPVAGADGQIEPEKSEDRLRAPGLCEAERSRLHSTSSKMTL